MFARFWATVRDAISVGLIVGLISFMSAPARADDGVKPLTFNYGPHKLDIYAPASLERSGASVLVFIHGGGWALGNRRHLHNKVGYFTRRGYLLVSLGYRLYPHASVLDQVADIESGLQWVRGHIGRFGGDPSNIHVMGHSAGAHLAALAIVRGQSGPLRSAILNDTKVYDVAAYANARDGNGLPLFYRQIFSPPSRWTEYSPVAYLAAARRLPPMLLAWSGGLTRKRRALTEAFAQKVRSVGGRVDVFAGADYRHLTINSKIGRRDDAFTQVVSAFLDRHDD